MALATPTGVEITILASKTAAYALILAQSGGTNPEASQEVLIFADGVNTTTGTPVAATTTGTTGQFVTPVNLIPGCIYQMVCPNDSGGFATTRFSAPATVDRIITAGA